MMKKFDILKTKQGIVVIATNNNRIDELLLDLEKKLLKLNYSGIILFDLLLTNGQSSNRFIQAKFENSHFNLRSLEAVNFNDLGSDLIQKVSEYHSKNLTQIKSSYLSSLQKNKIVQSLELA